MTTAAQRRIVYTVIVQDGEVIDADSRRVAPAILRSCGHDHRTEPAAAACLARLHATRCEQCGARGNAGRGCRSGSGHSWVESAAWYNARLHAHATGTMAYLSDDPTP